jgi:hypothetical protein
VFDRPKERVEIQDRWETAQGAVRVTISLYAALPVVQSRTGSLSIACTPRPLLFDYDADRWNASVEAVPVQDPRFLKAWGSTLYQIKLESKTPESAATGSLRFRPGL